MQDVVAQIKGTVGNGFHQDTHDTILSKCKVGCVGEKWGRSNLAAATSYMKGLEILQHTVFRVIFTILCDQMEVV